MKHARENVGGKDSSRLSRFHNMLFYENLSFILRISIDLPFSLHLPAMLAFAPSAPISISRPRTNFAVASRPIRVPTSRLSISCALLESTTHLFVISPLALFGASLARGPNTEAGDALTRVMSGYWQASALLLVAVLQHATGNTGAFAGGLLVQGVIVASLNWWEDLLKEIHSSDGSLEKIFAVWQPVASVAAAVGMLVQIPFQSCNFETTCACNAWREPPIKLFEILHIADMPTLEILANFGSTCYLTYLAYYLTFVIPKIGRKGRVNRDIFTAPEVLIRTGIIGPWGERKKEGQK